MQVTTRNTADSYTAQCWITGAAGFVDASPNVTPPDPARIISAPANVIGIANGFPLGTSPSVAAFVADGTGATLRFWWYDDTQATWVQSGNAFARTYAGNNVLDLVGLAAPGKRFFCQVTANTGVTKVAFLIR